MAPKFYPRRHVANGRNPKVSLVVSTYNRPDALDLCLQSIAGQTTLPNEVIIADDGSTDGTRKLIETFRVNFPIPLIHVWQEDRGFRLAMIRNKSIATGRCEYIIEIDGDLILHRDFVADHLHFARKGHFLKGGRVFLSRKLSENCCLSRKLPALSLFSRGISRRPNMIRCLSLSEYLASRYQKNKFTALGCNMSFWREDFIRINGYDEFFEGWGAEDYDFASRLTNSGIKRLSLKFSGIVYHLWHKKSFQQNVAENRQYYLNERNRKSARCTNGVSRYLSPDDMTRGTVNYEL
ncbi:MAG: glycosyltransferase family 2 protein [Tannerella sp.]|jgi:glycosyltransferase involved in cell wall biosynthesis|nr:glycosyltransferase family 2 protein [Tannerella sp.]